MRKVPTWNCWHFIMGTKMESRRKNRAVTADKCPPFSGSSIVTSEGHRPTFTLSSTALLLQLYHLQRASDCDSQRNAIGNSCIFFDQSNTPCATVYLSWCTLCAAAMQTHWRWPTHRHNLSHLFHVPAAHHFLTWYLIQCTCSNNGISYRIFITIIARASALLKTEMNVNMSVEIYFE